MAEFSSHSDADFHRNWKCEKSIVTIGGFTRVFWRYADHVLAKRKLRSLWPGGMSGWVVGGGWWVEGCGWMGVEKVRAWEVHFNTLRNVHSLSIYTMKSTFLFVMHLISFVGKGEFQTVFFLYFWTVLLYNIHCSKNTLLLNILLTIFMFLIL